MDDLAAKVFKVLHSKGLTFAVAESCTGGMLGARMTDLAGVSAVFLGGIIAYHNDVKRDMLHVPESLMIAHGAVSAECARAMVEGLIKCIGSDVGVSITGIAGPDGGTDKKPIGLVYIGVANNTHTDVHTHYFAGDRAAVRQQAVDASLRHIIDLLHAV